MCIYHHIYIVGKCIDVELYRKHITLQWQVYISPQIWQVYISPEI
jgi:hypothetical protein